MRVAAIGSLALLLLTACTHSKVIRITVINDSAANISNVIVDYPGATFGIASLQPGKAFRYSIKPTDKGALKIQFTDANGVNHAVDGAAVNKDDEGTITIKLSQEKATADVKLQHP